MCNYKTKNKVENCTEWNLTKYGVKRQRIHFCNIMFLVSMLFCNDVLKIHAILQSIRILNWMMYENRWLISIFLNFFRLSWFMIMYENEQTNYLSFFLIWNLKVLKKVIWMMYESRWLISILNCFRPSWFMIMYENKQTNCLSFPLIWNLKVLKKVIWMMYENRQITKILS
jgi:hypothetical protein